MNVTISKVVNPKTGRLIAVGGATHKKLLKEQLLKDVSDDDESVDRSITLALEAEEVEPLLE